MPDRYLAGEAFDDVEANRQDDVDQDDVDHELAVGIAERQWQRQQQGPGADPGKSAVRLATVDAGVTARHGGVGKFARLGALHCGWRELDAEMTLPRAAGLGPAAGDDRGPR